MSHTIDLLEKGYFTDVEPPKLVIATLEGVCNLRCSHCFWAHDLGKSAKRDWTSQLARIASWGSDLLYAGRILTPEGAKFIQDYYKLTGKKVGIIDNGYTILKHKELFALYDYINISIDGVPADHDLQRNMPGSSAVAWEAIFALKDAGLDPVIASCISPLNIKNWPQFENLLCDSNTPMSCTPILGVDTNKIRMPVFSERELIEAFELLLKGVPKLVNLLSPEHMETLLPILKDFQWKVVEDGYVTTVNGVLIKYRPYSISTLREVNLLWDGKSYAFMDALTAGNPVTEQRVLEAANAFAQREHLFVRALFE